MSDPSHCPPPLLSQATNQFTGPLQPKPLVANTPPVPPPLPLIHFAGTPLANINTNQQPTSCYHTSLTVNQPSFSWESTPPYQITPQGHPLSLLPIHSEHHSSKPFFVKFLTKQIKVCQGCRADYLRDAQGHRLPPSYDILVGHLECQEFCDKVTGLKQVSKETCVHFHDNPQCIVRKHPTFHAAHLTVPPAVMVRLGKVHKHFLNTNFGLQLSWTPWNPTLVPDPPTGRRV